MNDFIKILILVFVIIFGYGLTTLFRKWFDFATLMAVAIGCAVNANLYIAPKLDIEVGPFIFDMSSILYSLFIYTILVAIFDYGYKEGKSMTITSIFAILISGVIEMFARWSSTGEFTYDIFKTFAGYAFSCLGTFIGIWVTVALIKKLRSKNQNIYVAMLIGFATSMFFNNNIYFGGTALLELKFVDDYWKIFLGETIEKMICSILGLVCYNINKKVWIPRFSYIPRNEDFFN